MNLDKLFIEDFSIEKLNKADIQNGKQSGADNIFLEFLIPLWQLARKFLLMIYNKLWNANHSLPTNWLKAEFIPILKPRKSLEDIESNRPLQISLTSITVKTFKQMITHRLRLYLESNKILVEENSDFRNNISTTN